MVPQLDMSEISKFLYKMNDFVRALLPVVKIGDIIKCQRKGYCHYAIYVGNETVFHFTSDKALGTPVAKFDSIWECAAGGPATIDNSIDQITKPSSLDEIGERVLERHGKTDYDLCERNCQHEATFCRNGVRYSDQGNKVVIGFKIISAATTGFTLAIQVNNAIKDKVGSKMAIVISGIAGLAAGVTTFYFNSVMVHGLKIVSAATTGFTAAIQVYNAIEDKVGSKKAIVIGGIAGLAAGVTTIYFNSVVPTATTGITVAKLVYDYTKDKVGTGGAIVVGMLAGVTVAALRYHYNWIKTIGVTAVSLLWKLWKWFFPEKDDTAWI